MLIDCSKAGEYCDKSQYGECSWLHRFMLKLHVNYCRRCKKHTQDNTRLTKAIQDSGLKCMPESQKTALKKCLKEQDQL